MSRLHRSLTPLLLVLLVVAVGCTSMRGRADDALKKGDYRTAVDLYAQLLRSNPNDGDVKANLTRAERGLMDQLLDRAEATSRSGNQAEAMKAALEALTTKDRMHPESLDAPRPARLTAVVAWTKNTIATVVQYETSRGRALAAKHKRTMFNPWLGRPELAALAPELDADIKNSGIRTCMKSTTAAGEQAFTLELVAAYCKEVGGPLPAWKPRPILVGGVNLEGTIAGTPPGEKPEIDRVIAEAVERSVWFTSTSSLRATARLQGNVSANFTREQTELSRSWTESVPYEATESYQEAVQVPYMEAESYTEQIPYTAFEDRQDQCSPPRKDGSLCTTSHKVTKYRDEHRQRQVQKYRTEYQARTRQVTRYRDEPRIYRFPAMKQEGRYQASFNIRVDLGSGVRPVDARSTSEDARIAIDHDSEFAPAGVHPEHQVLPSAVSWRQQQRATLLASLSQSLETGWNQQFCSESIAAIEDAARCLRGRPKPMPKAVRAQVEALFGDDPDRVLALPRPGESVH